ncbi:MAG: ATP synthase subunit I, partial [Microcystaceae cyanobacterium]
MAQVSFWWRQILYLIQNLITTQLKSRVFPFFSRRRLRRTGKWLLGFIGIFAMLLWNWRLLLATASGMGLMLLVYRMQETNWQVYRSYWQRYLTGSNRKLTLAVGSGGIA